MDVLDGCVFVFCLIRLFWCVWLIFFCLVSLVVGVGVLWWMDVLGLLCDVGL